jgi:protein SCO1/2
VIRPRAPLAVAAALAILGLATPARAQFERPPPPGGTPIDAKPAILEQVRIDENLDAPLPLDTPFTDWRGQPFTLRQAFDGKKPVVISLVYYDCPMLCGLILTGMAKTMRQNGLELGKDYQAVTVSFDPADKPAMAAERRRGYLQSVGLSDRGGEWPFLVGPETSSRRLADALGFHYQKDPTTGEWAHMAAIFVVTPDGRVSRYLYGIEFPNKDFRLAVVEAGGGRVGTSFDRLLLTCYRYDPASRKYAPYAFGFLRIGGLLTLFGLAALIGRLVWRERRQERKEPPPGQAAPSRHDA